MDYPAACNSLEILLLNTGIDKDDFKIELEKKGVEVLSDSSEIQEHNDQRIIMIQCDLEEAILQIQEHGSGHTDMILTSSETIGKMFCDNLSSACTFVNCSTRCADGYRLGFGCEVGINTTLGSWFRGPVGIEGLMTTQLMANTI